MNQIWFDDSGKHGGPVFVLGGFLAKVEEWISFAGKWQHLLTNEARRKLDYIKGYEAFGLRDQFMHWTEKERDDRLMEFMPIIGKYSGKGLAIVIPHDKFVEILKQPFPPYKNPHIYAYAICFSLMLHYAHGNPNREKIELIFDRDVIHRKQAEGAYKSMYRIYPPDYMSLLGRPEPRFEDDKEFNALQASDLLAYCVRARYETDTRYDDVRKSPVFEWLAGGPKRHFQENFYGVGKHTILIEVGEAEMIAFKRDLQRMQSEIVRKRRKVRNA